MNKLESTKLKMKEFENKLKNHFKEDYKEVIKSKSNNNQQEIKIIENKNKINIKNDKSKLSFKPVDVCKYDKIKKLENFVNNFSENNNKNDLDSLNKLNKYNFDDNYKNHLLTFLNQLTDKEEINLNQLNKKEYSSILNQITLENLEFINMKKSFNNKIKENENKINELKKEINNKSNNNKENDGMSKLEINDFLNETNNKLKLLNQNNQNSLNDLNLLKSNLFK